MYVLADVPNRTKFLRSVYMYDLLYVMCRTHTRAHTHTHAHIYTRTYTHTRTHIYTRTYTHARTHTLTHMHTHAHTHTLTHTLTHTHSLSHTHTGATDIMKGTHGTCTNPALWYAKYVKRDLYIPKETYINQNISIKGTNEYDTNQKKPTFYL